MGKVPTSRDVAASAGVSQSTVSNVLTGRPGISQATRERVLKVAKELRYRPNLAARSMRTQRTGRLALVLPITTWFASKILAGATQAAQKAGYTIEVHTLPGDFHARQQRLDEIVNSGQFEGVLSFVPMPPCPSGEGGATVLSLAEFDDDMKVSGDLTDPAPLVTMIEELASRGHRRFLHITGALAYPSARARRDAYLMTIEKLGLQSLGVIEGDWTGESGLNAIRSLPDDAPPLAVVASNDLVATGVVRGALERGWTVPDDLCVTGWDDLVSSALQVPSITTVFLDYQRLGARSVQRLVATLRDEPEPPSSGGLQRIIWRESTGDGFSETTPHGND